MPYAGKRKRSPTYTHGGISSKRRRTGKHVKRKSRASVNRMHAVARRRYLNLQRRSPQINRLNQRLNVIARQARTDLSTHVHRTRQTTDIRAPNNTVAYNEYCQKTIASLEQAMSYLRYYDANTPGTLLINVAGNGLYSREFQIKNIHSSIRVRNNYRYPAQVRIYSCTPKVDTDNKPYTYFTQGVADSSSTGYAAADLEAYPTDFKQVNDMWHLKCVFNGTLESGRTCTASHDTGPFKYNPAVTDTHSLVYQKKFGGHLFFLRVSGDIGHTTITSGVEDEQEAGACEVEVLEKRRYDIEYDAGGAKLNDYSIANADVGATEDIIAAVGGSDTYTTVAS